MVLPHPELLRKIRNTKGIINYNKSHLVPSLATKYPNDYVSIDIYDKIQRTKPWINTSGQTFHLTSPLASPLTSPLSTSQQISIDKVLVLCVDFSDQQAQTNISEIYNRFFSNTGNSLRNYFVEVSSSRYIPEGNVYGWYRAPNPLTYYSHGEYGLGQWPNNAERLVEEVVEMAKNDQNIDWPSFDTNNNGKIDNLVIIHAGPDGSSADASPNNIWAYVSSIRVKAVQGKEVSKYAMVSEYLEAPTDAPIIGVYCHEFGHLLGLPDLYDDTLNSNGVGYYSLMSSSNWINQGTTSAHLDPWSKKKLGFVDIIEDPTGHVVLPAVETSAKVVKYTTPDPKEYFLVENRQKILYDKVLPSEGILIWRINENQENNNNETCFLVGLLQADGLKDLENKANNGDSGDSYPGSSRNKTFGMFTNPDTSLCNGTKQKLLISHISNSSPIMTFDSSFTDVQPVEETRSNMATFLLGTGLIIGSAYMVKKGDIAKRRYEQKKI